MVTFSIMLLLSRLVPYSFHTFQESKKELITEAFYESQATYVKLIKEQRGNSTYFVRKISAQSLLPLLEFEKWLPEVFDCLNQLKSQKLRQNEAHGLLLRVDIFLSAYFKYRNIAVPESEFGKFQQDEIEISKALLKFQSQLPDLHRYSKITWSLFIRTLRTFISKQSSEQTISTSDLDNLAQAYKELFLQADQSN